MLTEENEKRSQAHFKKFDLSINLILNHYFISLYTLSLFSAYWNYGERLLRLTAPETTGDPQSRAAIRAWCPIRPFSSCFSLVSHISFYKVYWVYINSFLIPTWPWQPQIMVVIFYGIKDNRTGNDSKFVNSFVLPYVLKRIQCYWQIVA